MKNIKVLFLESNPKSTDSTIIVAGGASERVHFLQFER